MCVQESKLRELSAQVAEHKSAVQLASTGSLTPLPRSQHHSTNGAHHAADTHADAADAADGEVAARGLSIRVSRSGSGVCETDINAFDDIRLSSSGVVTSRHESMSGAAAGAGQQDAGLAAAESAAALAGLQSRAAALHAELEAVRRQLAAVAADRDRLADELRLAVAAAAAAAAPSPPPPPAAAAAAESAAHVARLLIALECAQRALGIVKGADTGAALRTMEAAVDGAISRAQKAQTSAQAAAEMVATAADSAMDTFLATLSEASGRLEEAGAEVSAPCSPDTHTHTHT